MSLTVTLRIERKRPGYPGWVSWGQVLRLPVFSVFITDNAPDCPVHLTSEAPAKGCPLAPSDLNCCLFCFRRKHRRARDRSRSSSSSSQSSHSYKAEEYTEETEEREESTTGFDKSRLGTKDFVGPSERGGRARGTFVRSCPLSLLPILVM